MKIFEELKANINALREYDDGDDATADTFDALLFCIGLLEKGYSLNHEVEDFDTYDLDDIPDAGSEWLEKAQDAIAERIKLARLESRLDFFLQAPEDKTIWDAYNELEKSISKEQYNEELIIPWEQFNDWTHEEIYTHIQKYKED